MTNELIAEARKFLATPNLGKDMARELNKALAYMWELADIAEAAEARVKELEDGEWEYRCTNEQNSVPLSVSPESHREHCSGVIERRRKAGPWEPLPQRTACSRGARPERRERDMSDLHDARVITRKFGRIEAAPKSATNTLGA